MGFDAYRLFNRARDRRPYASTLETPITPGPSPAGGGPARGGPAAPDDAAGSPQPLGQFITPQSLVTFPGATGVIYVLKQAVFLLVPAAVAIEIWIGFVLSVLVGLGIFYMNVTDPAAPVKGREFGISAIIAGLNTVVLFVATSHLPNA
jgi:hypothetical protein